MKGKMFDLVRSGLGGLCISITFLLTAVLVLAVHSTVSGSEASFTTMSSSSPVVYQSGPTEGLEGVSSSSSTSTFLIQPGSEGKDTCYGTVYATDGTPDAGELYMGGWGDWYYDFFEFDLSGSPSANDTTTVTLYLYGAAPSDGSDPEFQLYRITENWTESGVTYSSNPASIFYKNFGSFAVSSSPAWNSVDITDLYKSWKNGTYSNYGIKLVPTKNNHTNGSIYSSDNSDSTHRPKLEIIYAGSSTTPTPTPTPTTSQFSVVEHLMTYLSGDDFNGEYSSGKTPPEKTTFSNTDTCATHWFSYKNATSGDTVKWEWYEPDGTYTTSNGTFSYTNGWWWYSIGIKGYSPASKLGEWQVKVYRNDQLLFTDTFIIQKDSTIPSGSVSINSGASYTNTTTVTLTLSATDDGGITGYYLSTSSSTPSASDSGWTSVSSTTSYSGSISYTLSSGAGSKTVYAWYKDTDGKVSDTASDSITLDKVVPTITITSPTSSPSYTITSSTISLSGSASDSTSGIKEVTWSSDKGGSGTASGTTSWSISSISLSNGENNITVTAKDNGGNTSTDTITVTYNADGAPTVTTGSTTDFTPNFATLSGTVNANGLPTTAWFEYGTVRGTYGNKTTTQTVTGSNDTTVSITITGWTSETTYYYQIYYRIAAKNSAGTSYGKEKESPLIVVDDFPTPTPTLTTTPKPSPIQTPTPTSILTGSININGGATYTNSTTVTLNLSASNITGVTGYYLSTSSTKPSSGDTGWVSISSTTSYSAGVSYTLSSGDGNKTVYVWYKDTAGNISDVANDSIILDTTAPTITITSPTSDSTYTTTGAIINIGGSASDSTSGLNSVTWINSRGGSGTASGTIGWSISNINLASGANIIMVTAKDGAGNTGTDTITVIYETPPQTPIITPTPIPTLINCTVESITVSRYKLKIKRKETYDVTIAVSGEDDCLVEGEIVTATINATGKRLISISPSTQATDENGESPFTITAKNKVGIARVNFRAGDFKKSITVKVKR